MPQTRRRRATHLEPLEYQQLASFRYSLRTYLRFSEAAAEKLGLTAQHYQALLAVCAAPGGVTINDLAQQLLIRHNSAVGLVDRLTKRGLLAREPAPARCGVSRIPSPGHRWRESRSGSESWPRSCRRPSAPQSGA